MVIYKVDPGMHPVVGLAAKSYVYDNALDANRMFRMLKEDGWTPMMYWAMVKEWEHYDYS